MPGTLSRTLTPPFTLMLGKPKPENMAGQSRLQGDGRGPALYLISKNDEIYENDILRNPGSVKPWLDYVGFKRQYVHFRFQNIHIGDPSAQSTDST